jgi:hypothetical protein
VVEMAMTANDHLDHGGVISRRRMFSLTPSGLVPASKRMWCW